VPWATEVPLDAKDRGALKAMPFGTQPLTHYRAINAAEEEKLAA
jgi:hypothetical protein